MYLIQLSATGTTIALTIVSSLKIVMMQLSVLCCLTSWANCELYLKGSQISNPQLLDLANRLIHEYQQVEEAPKREENIKHVHRLLAQVRKQHQAIRAVGVDPELLELSIYVSDIAKSPHIVRAFASEYAGNLFAAFLDHSALSLKWVSTLPEWKALNGEQKRIITQGVLGHDGPATQGSWWQQNYEGQTNKIYPAVKSKEAFLHAYLDRIDQGSLVLDDQGEVQGGLRKIAENIFLFNDSITDFGAALRSVFEQTHQGTLRQLAYLDGIRSNFFAPQDDLSFLQDFRAPLRSTEKFKYKIDLYSNPLVITLSRGNQVTIETFAQLWRGLAL